MDVIPEAGAPAPGPAALNPPFLQSGDWARFQTSLGKQVLFEEGPGWQFLATVEVTPVGSYLYLPYGPSFATTAGFEAVMTRLTALARQRRAVFIRIEPTGVLAEDYLVRQGFRRIGALNPEHTWVLDLAPEEKDLLAAMRQTNRNLFNNYHKKGIAIRASDNPAEISHLTRLLASVADHNDISVHGEDYFRRQMVSGVAKLYLAEFEGSVIGAALVYDSATTRYYAHAAADYEHRRLSVGNVLVTQMIMDAKRLGLTTFDFYGVTVSDDPADPWQGFTKFKQSFGGRLVTYSGTWDRPLNRLRYGLFTASRRFNRWARRLVRRLRPGG